MTMQEWLRSQPHSHWCPLCKRPVTKWHEHHGPEKIWKPGMKAAKIDKAAKPIGPAA